ncbi:hypothetical protein D3C71_1721920 [compost metagenome]
MADQPARSSTLLIAPTGAVVNQAGAWAWLAWALISARIGRPSFSALERVVSTSAAAPSEMDEALAAVTVPSLAKAGFSVGILAGSAFSGCSSFSTTVSPLRPLTVTGVISLTKLPSSVARRARFRLSMA